MRQLNVFCEGTTEQVFCSQVLQAHLFPHGNGIIHTLAVGNKDHHHIYGLGTRAKYERVRRFICNTIKHREGPNVYFSTLFDLYGLPSDFPGTTSSTVSRADPVSYVSSIEKAFAEDVDYYRFVPHLQLYEFETILFADPNAFAVAFEDCEKEIERLKEIAGSEPTIEHIDDGADSAPSKRIIRVIPEYDGRKASAGPDIAATIGLARIRKQCPHFNAWLTQLEALSWATDENAPV